MQPRLIRFHGNQLLHGHAPGGDGAGLVQAEGIHPGQGFYAVQLLHQRALAAQLYHACGHGQTHQQHQSLGNHANHRRHGGGHRVRQQRPLQEELLGEQHQTQGHQQYAHQTDQLVKVGHQGGLGPLDGPGRAGQPGSVAVVAHAHQLRSDPSLAQVAARQQPVAPALAYRVALAGEQSLIGRAHAADRHRVRHHLISRPENHQVALHQFLRPAGPLPALPQHMGCGGVEHLQLADGLAGPQLLHGADERVGNHHAHEEHVPPAAHQRQAHRQRQVQPVEERQQVLPEDLTHALAPAAVHHIAQARLMTGLRLGLGQAAGGRFDPILRQRVGLLSCILHACLPVISGIPCHHTTNRAG